MQISILCLQAAQNHGSTCRRFLHGGCFPYPNLRVRLSNAVGAVATSTEMESMKRYGMTIRLNPGCEEAYRRYHAATWPEVLEMIRACHISNYSIYLIDGILFSYFEYHGDDFQTDIARMAAHPKTQEWWAIMEPMQQPLTTRKSGEWWAGMEEVFHID